MADRILVLVGSLGYDEYRGGLSVRGEQVITFEQARALRANYLKLSVDWQHLLARGRSPQDFTRELSTLLSAYKGGGCGIRINYRGESAKGVVALGDKWRVRPTDELLKRLNRFLGDDGVDVVYGMRKADFSHDAFTDE